MILPQGVIHREIIKRYGGVIIRMPTCKIGAPAVFPYMHAGWINRQRQILFYWGLCFENPRIPLARLHRQHDPGHFRSARRARARGINNLAARHNFARCQRHAFDPPTCRVLLHRNNFV